MMRRAIDKEEEILDLNRANVDTDSLEMMEKIARRVGFRMPEEHDHDS